jgi:hypothetical protein
MNSSSSRNTQIISVFAAGQTSTTELANIFGVSVSTIRRVLTSAALAGVIIGTAVAPNTAEAALSGADKEAADNYFSNNPEIAHFKPELVTRVYESDTLQQANDALKGNSYYTGYDNGDRVVQILPIKPTQDDAQKPQNSLAPIVPIEPVVTPPDAQSTHTASKLVDEPPVLNAPAKTTSLAEKLASRSGYDQLQDVKINSIKTAQTTRDDGQDLKIEQASSAAAFALGRADAAHKNAMDNEAVLDAKIDQNKNDQKGIDDKQDNDIKAATMGVNYARQQIDKETSARLESDNNLQAQIDGAAMQQANRDRTAQQHVSLEAAVDGATGQTGPVGADGAKGTDGKDGTAGRDGVDGKDGKDGAKGDTGAAGQNGRDLTQDHYSRMNAAAALAASHVEQDEIDQNKSALSDVKGTAEQAANDSKTAQDTAEGAAKQLQMVQSDKYQRMVQAKTQAEIDASAHATQQKVAQQQQAAENKTAMAAKQQKIESVYYGEQIQTLAQTQQEQQGEILAESHSRAVADAQTLGQANDFTNKKFNDLKSEVDGNKKEAAAGSASAMAQANIPQVQESQQFAVGAGVGGYDSQNAISVGASFHASRATIVKMSVSDDTQSNFGYGAGVSVGW